MRSAVTPDGIHLRVLARTLPFAALVALTTFSPGVCAVPGGPRARPALHDYIVRVWDMDHGLPDYAANNFLQTPGGYLWIQTFEGLVRFDGARFDLMNRLNTPGFPGKAMSGLLLDSQARIWAAADSGLACLCSGGSWSQYPLADGKPAANLRYLVEGEPGSIFAVSPDNRILRLRGGKFEAAPQPLFAGPPSLLRASDGQIWAWDSRRVFQLQNGNWLPVEAPWLSRDDSLQGAGASHDGGIWVASTSRIEKLHRGVWSRTRHLPAGFRFSDPVLLLEDSAETLWAGDTLKGLLAFQSDGQVVRFGRPEGLSSLAIRALFEDREKNIWVGTHGGGMIRLRRRAVQLFGEEEGLAQVMTNTVAQRNDGALLVATYGGGIQVFDSDRRSFAPPFRFPGSGNLNENSLVSAALADRAGTVWVSLQKNGLFRLGPSGLDDTGLGALSDQNAKALFQDSAGDLWIGTDHGVSRYASGRLTVFHESDGMPTTTIASFAEGPGHEIWVGARTGLYRLHEGRFEKFPGIDEPVDALLGDERGLWIGPQNGGLEYLRNGALRSFGPAQGMPPIRVTGFAKDLQGRLWIATFRDGLLCIRPESLTDSGRAPADIIWLKSDDGLGTNQFRSGYQPNVWRGKHGRLWFATLKGLVMANPEELRPNRATPLVLIEAVGANGKTIDATGTLARDLRLPPGSGSIRIFFTAPSFAAPEKVRFKYQFGNTDAAWIETSERSVTLGELDPGRYTFRVMAANDSGLWNPAPAVVSFEVSPHFWETWQFRLFALLCAGVFSAAAVYGLQRNALLRRTRQLKVEQGLRHHVEQLQTVLKASEEKFSKAFRSSPRPLSIQSQDGRFVDVSESFLEVTGIGRDELIGKTFAEIGIGVPTSLAERLRAAAEGREPVRGLDAEFRGSDGKVRQWIVTAEVIELDGIKHLLVASDDVTERRRLEEKVLQSQK
ncbi:MAG: PAS domain S-box protein, partial [Acidobacteriota bacterium]|nr:PAS domain S-box protein [Acidobacteriota bacterium]